VADGTVSKQTTASVKGDGGSTLYSPTGSSGDSYQFTSIDGQSHLAVTVTKGNDGKYYVSKVEPS
jgi:hypothetical protein